MFCTEERVLSANKMREIKIGPVPISNVSCFNDNVWEAIGRPGLEAVIKTSILAILAMATVLANLIFILVLRSNKFRRHAHVQSRYLLIAMSYNCILNGCCILMFSIYPGIMDCWPFGDLVCQAQAVLYGALNQHFCILIMTMGVDRYFSLAFPHKYSQLFNAKIVGLFIGVSWFGSIAMYCAWVVPEKSYIFNKAGIRMCLPFYGSNNVKILAYCLFYFIPTLVLMQCYGSIFHSKRMQAMRRATKSASNLNQHSANAVKEQDMDPKPGEMSTSDSSLALPKPISSTAKLLFATNGLASNPAKHLGILNLKACHYGLLTHPRIVADQRQHYNMARSMAVLSLSFIILVTPWTMKEVAVSCIGSKLSPAWDFLLTCLGMSYVLWNPFLFAVFNVRFQQAAREFIKEEILCQRPLDECCASHAAGGHGHGHGHGHGGGGVGAEVGLRLTRSATMTAMSAAAIIGDPNISKSLTLPARNSRKVRDDFCLEPKRFQPQPLEATFIYPLLNGRAMSAPRLAQQSTTIAENMQEKYWGEILERSLSQATLNRP